MTRGDFISTLRGFAVVILIIAPMAWCGVQMHNIPFMDFQLQQKEANSILGVTILVFLLEGIVWLAIGGIPELLAERRRRTEEEAWRKNHVHTWSGCVCEDKRCYATRHEVDEKCICKKCGAEVHNGAWSQWDYGSTRVEELVCSNCGETLQSSSYYAG